MNQKKVNINVYMIVEEESTDNHTVNNSSENTDDRKTGGTVQKKKVCNLMFLSSFASDQEGSGQLPKQIPELI